jgi:N-acetylmuramoyl-L-alanine amidase
MRLDKTVIQTVFRLLHAAAMFISLICVLATMTAMPLAIASDEASPSQENRSVPTIFYAGRIAGNGKSTRIFFDIDRKMEFSNFFMDNPARLVIDGPPMLFRFANPNDLEPRGLVSFLRYGAIARDRSRIVISLAGPARISDISIREINDGALYRLVIDLASVDPQVFEALVRKQQQITEKSAKNATSGNVPDFEPKSEGRFRIVIDPGHGGIDSGAIGVNGTREKDLTLEISDLIAKQIRELGTFDVKLTRNEDIYLSLRERVDFSRQAEADLIISVHADSLRQKWVRGAAVYTLSQTASDDLAEQLAHSENMTDIVAGLDSPEEDEVVTGILADLTARETKVFSRRFSSTLIRFLEPELNMLKNPQRSASFVVLQAPEVPGVLVELGYLSNAEDEKMLTDPEWQEDVAVLVARAVVTFFESRSD